MVTIVTKVTIVTSILVLGDRIKLRGECNLLIEIVTLTALGSAMLNRKSQKCVRSVEHSNSVTLYHSNLDENRNVANLKGDIKEVFPQLTYLPSFDSRHCHRT